MQLVNQLGANEGEKTNTKHKHIVKLKKVEQAEQSVRRKKVKEYIAILYMHSPSERVHRKRGSYYLQGEAWVVGIEKATLLFTKYPF